MTFCGFAFRIWIDNTSVFIEEFEVEHFYNMFPGTPQYILEERLRDWLLKDGMCVGAKDVKIIPNKEVGKKLRLT